MSDFNNVSAGMRAKLQEFTALPLYWPNDTREATAKEAPNGFVYSEIAVVDERPISLGPIGSQYRRDTYEFRIYVYVPRGTLVGAAENHATAIRALFGVDSVAGAKMLHKTIGIGQAVDASLGQYWCVPVIVSMFADRLE